ncbi:uncharacterized protein LOC121729221 [Aricia agestis]|uniref:uncharacterized protein LOC121729221 n=1 Tax=Aricia agestis TaxID=91739 RepID=UPI001C20413D|nr:uncharacterized protein LOC121729221 [Aricia agestis]
MQLTLTSPVVQSYIVYSAVLALKLLFMSALTAATRLTKGIYANPEDAKTLGGKVKYDDARIERIRRAHLNDLENIPAFWVLAALYVTTGPVAAWATLLFRIFTLGRIIHTVVYAIIPLPQPARGLAFGIPMLTLFYMGSQVILYYITLSNPVLQSYIVYSAMLALKLLFLSSLTSLTRLAKGVFANPEDAKTFGGKVKYDDASVERIRRAHLNDLENIPAFWVLGALYVTTGPYELFATFLFRIFTLSRIMHTLVYAIYPLPQPARRIAYRTSLLILCYMGVQVTIYYATAM